MYLTKMMKSD